MIDLKTPLAAFVLAATAVIQPAQAQDPVTLQMTSTWPQGMDLIDVDEEFVRIVNRVGGGSVSIDFVPGNTLVPPTGVFDAVQTGGITASADWPGYWGGVDSAFSLIAAFPMFMTGADFVIWINEYGGRELVEEVYAQHGIKYIPHGVLSMESGLRSNGPLTSLDDLKGKRLRMAGRPIGAILNQLGAAQVNVSGGEVYQALERGVVDAAEFSVPSTDISMGFAEVTDNWMAPGWHQAGSIVGTMINMDVWNGLSDQQQAVLEVSAQASMIWSIAYYERASAEATVKFTDDGITVNHLSNADLDRLQTMANDLLVQESCDNPLYAKIAASQIRYMQSYAPWREMQGDFAMGRNMATLPDLASIEACME